MAPEIINSSGHDLNVDWWAIGIIIYELVIGCTPFQNDDETILKTKIKNGLVEFPDRTKYKIKYTNEF